MLQLNIKKANIKLVMGLKTLTKCGCHPAVMAFFVFNIHPKEFHYDGRAENTTALVANNLAFSFGKVFSLPSPYYVQSTEKENQMKQSIDIDEVTVTFSKLQESHDFLSWLARGKNRGDYPTEFTGLGALFQVLAEYTELKSNQITKEGE